MRRRAWLSALVLLPFLMGSETPRGCGPTPPPAPVPPGVSTLIVPAGHGFGGGTIYYPSAAARRYGAVAVVSGYLGTQRSTRWYGPLLAEHGFVVFTIETNTVFDDPESRSRQLLEALRYLIETSSVRAIVDPARLAVMGWSMGGGGALEASLDAPVLKAAVALAPWSERENFSAVSVPTLVIACELDDTAPNVDHSIPIYEGVPATVPKTYLEIAGADHFCVASESDTVGDHVLAWMLRFVDGDESVSTFLCPPPEVGGAVSASASSCPF